jgi:putative DNA primase/helicase
MGDDYQPRRWSTWAPKIFSGIGRLADTIEDRAIKIQMRRRRKDEFAERLRHGTRFEDLRRKCIRFIADHANSIRELESTIPAALNDRAADNWLPLLSLAELAGPEWATTARQAALELSGSEDTEALGTNAQLLADIQLVFHEVDNDRLASRDLSERLAGIEGRPWAEFGKSRKPISVNQLANLLREFGIFSRGIRIGENTPKGYLLSDFSDAFSRYLAETGISKRNNATSPTGTGENSLFQGATQEACCGSEKGILAPENAACCVVADQKVEIADDKVYV